jgi:hypothetical protein
MTSLERIVSALLHASLALYPARYRREYGEECASVLQLALDEAAAGGWLCLLGFCARECRDLPLALLREHSREWKLRMNSVHPASSMTDESLSIRQVLLFLVPFLVVFITSLGEWTGSNFWVIPILGLLAVVVVVTIAGLIKGFPRWALSSLGLVISIANLFTFNSLMVWAEPILGRLKHFLWTDFIPGRILYALIAEVFSLMPTFALLVALALLSCVLPALSSFRQRLGQDWTLLPFLLYSTRLLAPFYADAYRGLEPYQILFTLIMAGGAWFYLRTSHPLRRMALLPVATLLSGLVLALGIYLIYPVQTWVIEAITSFPRWWEGLNPLLSVLAMLAVLYLTAALGVVLHREKLESLTSD